MIFWKKIDCLQFRGIIDGSLSYNEPIDLSSALNWDGVRWVREGT